MSKIDKLRDKVAKLLRQAEDVAGTPEEGVFQAKAFELMAKYGIDQAEVDAARQGLDVSALADAEQWLVAIEGKYAQAQMLLLHNLAGALHGKTVYTKTRAGFSMFVYAVPRHLERIKMLWSILQPQMMRLVEQVRPEEPLVSYRAVYDYEAHSFRYDEVPAPGKLRSYRRSWIAGFGSAVGERLRAEENKALEGSSGALVLFRGDKQRAEVALRAAHPRTTSSRRSSINPHGYAHGQRDGRSATFNHALR